MGHGDLTTYVRDAYVVVFMLLAILGLRDWLRDRAHRSTLWFGLMFLTLASVTVASRVMDAQGDDVPDYLRKLMILVLLTYPVCLHRFEQSFAAPRRLERRIVVGLCLILAAWTVLLPTIPGPDEPTTTAMRVYGLAFTGVWTVVSLRVVLGFVLAGRGKPRIVRARMRFLALGVALLTSALVVGQVNPGGSETLNAVLVAVSAIVTLAGYRPPRILRYMWRWPDLERTRQATARMMVLQTRQGILDVILPATSRLVGAEGAALVGPDGVVTGVWGITEEEALEGCRQLEEAPVAGGIQQRGHFVSCAMGKGRLVMRRAGATPFFGVDEFGMLTGFAAMAESAIQRVTYTERMRASEALLRSAQSMARLGSWQWDIPSDTVTWSEQMYEIFGLEPGTEIDFATYQSLLHPEERPRISAIVAQALKDGTAYEFDHRIVRADGTAVYVNASGEPVRDGDGAVVGLKGVSLDITERKLAEEQLRAAFEAERELVDRLAAIDEMKSNILAAVSHELRTPLTAVLGFAITLRDRADMLGEGQRTEILEHLVRQAERLERLLADLLDLDRMRRGVVEPNLQKADLGTLVANVVKELPELAAVTEVEITSVPCRLDTAKIERVVENLVLNAHKHTPDGTTVWVRVACEDDGAVVIVEDSGQGVPVHEREQIFEPFQRGEHELGHAPGTGIGLALVAQFTKLHGGTVTIGDRAGGGASFRVWLPANVDDSTDQRSSGRGTTLLAARRPMH